MLSFQVKEEVVDKILHEFHQHGDSAQKYMQGSRSMKIDNWLLLDSFVEGRGSSFGACNRASQIHSKCSRRHMSMKQHQKHGSHSLCLVSFTSKLTYNFRGIILLQSLFF